jgi:hypothetical protein
MRGQHDLWSNEKCGRFPGVGGRVVSVECSFHIGGRGIRSPENFILQMRRRFLFPAIRRHMIDFLAAIDSRGKPVSDIEEGHISVACCILANMALKTGRTLAWDPAAQRIANDDEANRLVRRPYRRPWVHPEPEAV